MAKLQGEIWLADESSSRLMLDQIVLLQAVVDEGSITAAAKRVGISYKTAWQRLERLNNLSPRPMLARSAGGSKGGGSSLTEYGEKILSGFNELQKHHEKFLEDTGRRLSSLDDLSTFMKSTRLNSSARNQFLGNISNIEIGAVNSEVVMELSSGISLVAMVTEQSRQDMGLSCGMPIVALVKASSITVSMGEQPPLVSARNKLAGKISRLTEGAVNTELSIDLGEDKTLSVIITHKSKEELGLEVGSAVWAFFKASSVILMAP